MREIVLDTETTGLNPKNGDRIIEIACVELINHVPTGKHWHSYINPERSVSAEATAVHGISSEFLLDKPLFKDIVDDLLTFIGTTPLVIHNAEFDLGFINAELQRLEKILLFKEQTVDTLAMARKKFPGAPASLDALCKRFNIDLSARSYHGALLDAQLLADVYLELKGGRQVKFEIFQTETNNQSIDYEGNLINNETLALRYQKISRPARPFNPTTEEYEAHVLLIQKLKDAKWLLFKN
ncbi:MAG: DNA polymerase III subunit epsilon [Alphaproteobacteria bacterium]|nr:DNA polymerase III subunit epsilon [Alphaproteobacteria bacterium]